ncbi:MAG: hypothetical protein RLZZ293_1196 [Pseudomonadota bacterium]|jgi:pantothenate kinase type III
MHLIIDIGNTLIKFAYFENKQLMQVIKLAKEELSNLQLEQLIDLKVTKISLVSVNSTSCQLICNYLTQANLDFKQIMTSQLTNYLSPDIPLTIGVDIVLPVIAVLTLYQLNDFYIVNAGTATTVCQVKSGKIIDYMIIPGFSLMQTSLEQISPALINNPRLIQGIYQVQNKFVIDCQPLIATGGNYLQFNTIAQYLEEFLLVIGANLISLS